jgi:FkbM family methyltransferase
MRSLLKHLPLYERAKASYIYDLFWKLADKRIIEERNNEIEFYRNLLVGFRKGDLIFDIGADGGFKTGIFRKLQATVVAVDPDESNQKVLRKRFVTWRRQKKVIVVGKAVSESNGRETFWVDEPGSGKNTLNRKWVGILRTDRNRFGTELKFDNSRQVETITLETLISTYGSPFFVKIDVEGNELNVLKGLKRPVPYLSFEVNLPEFKNEGFNCISLLEALAQRGEFNYLVENRAELALEDWLDAPQFIRKYQECAESCIEVFWKTTR